MDYEKAYKEALEKIREGLQPLPDGAKISGVTRAFLEEVFPELNESKDEKIRKALVRFHKSTIDIDGIKGKDILAWLEKQKSVSEIVERCKNSWYNEGKIAGKFEGITDDEKYQQGWHDALEKQGEQKPTDNVEPKFKVGDFIVNDYCMGKVMKLTNDTYLLDTGQGIPFSCEHNAHLWTIQDAKDGDVLVDVYGNIGIFQKNDDFDWSSYCSLGHNGGFRCFAIEHELDGSHPATKEQRDLLFKKIEEAGYQWDSEKKELKLLISNGGDFESNNSKQKPSWSEEDEKIITALKEGFRYHQLFNPTFGEVPNAEIISWIKSLKERLS